MPRFYCDFPLAIGRLTVLPDDTARHAVGALRLREGAAVTLFNGNGAEYHGSLVLQGKGAAVLVAQCTAPQRESNLHITLAQGISSGERMDLTLQKTVELGIAAIQPVMMRRSVVKLSGDKSDRRLRHWQGVVVSACEQCGRNVIPPVAPIAEFMLWLREIKREVQASSVAPVCYLLDPAAQVGLRDLPAPSGPIFLLAGPEGGFDPVERNAALAAGCLPVRLGPRILRTETAALAALAAMQTLWGDFQ